MPEAEDLFGLPVEGFTKARDDLAKRLKQSGDEDGAKAVKALRKPSVAAWAVNQLARSRPKDVGSTLAAGEALRRAQQAAMSGGGRAKLQEATAARKRVIDRLVEEAARVLEGSGRQANRAVLDDVAATLTATATDRDVAERVRRGVLEREAMPPSGFEELFALQGPPPRAPAGRGRKRRATGAAADDRAVKVAERAVADRRERAERAASEAAGAGAEARRLDEEASKAERSAARLRKEAGAAGTRAEKLRRSAEQAREDLDQAEQELAAMGSS